MSSGNEISTETAFVARNLPRKRQGKAVTRTRLKRISRTIDKHVLCTTRAEAVELKAAQFTMVPILVCVNPKGSLVLIGCGRDRSRSQRHCKTIFYLEQPRNLLQINIVGIITINLFLI